MTDNDNSIIERIQGGETSEFAQLVKRYGPSLMVFVGRIVGVQEDTEDVVQNTFVAAYQHLNDYDPQKASVSTHLSQPGSNALPITKRSTICGSENGKSCCRLT